MIVIGIILSFVALAYLCWLLFALAVYALPFFVGVSVGLTAYDSNSGPVAAIVIGVIAGSTVLLLGQIAFAGLRSPVMPAALALIFAVPAAVAGYHAVAGLTYLFIPAGAWRDVIAILGAIVVATTACARMAVSSPPEIGQGLVAEVTSPDLPASRTSEASTRRL